MPESARWVQYEEDLGQRCAVDFQTGEVTVQTLVRLSDDPSSPEVLADISRAIQDLLLCEQECPFRLALGQADKPLAPARPDRAPLHWDNVRRGWVYRVRKGDSLWALSQRFRVRTAELAARNGLAADQWLQEGQELIVPEASPHLNLRGDTPRRPAAAPILGGQLRTEAGDEVGRENARAYADAIVSRAPIAVEEIVGADNRTRKVLTLKFRLAANHIQVRAMRFRQLIDKYATVFDLDPRMLYAIIHTESAFNPRARSSAPAYGLMQIVPSAGGREARDLLFKDDRTLSPRFLYDPENNVKLGAAYLHILADRYLKDVRNRESRLYCMIAAYNAGPNSVVRTFARLPSARRAAASINALPPSEVLRLLKNDLPSAEGRGYVSKVTGRMPIYEGFATP
jgi:soluble lytic murein transglycosylase-like protein